MLDPLHTFDHQDAVWWSLISFHQTATQLLQDFAWTGICSANPSAALKVWELSARPVEFKRNEPMMLDVGRPSDMDLRIFGPQFRRCVLIFAPSTFLPIVPPFWWNLRKTSATLASCPAKQFPSMYLYIPIYKNFLAGMTHLWIRGSWSTLATKCWHPR